MDKAAAISDGEWAERLAPIIEDWEDRLAFYTICMASLEEEQGVTLTPETVQKGDEVMTRFGWARVISVNRLTVTTVLNDGYTRKRAYTELNGCRRPSEVEGSND